MIRHQRSKCSTNIQRRLTVPIAIVISLCLAGCTPSTQRDSQRAWAQLRDNSLNAARATGGMVVNTSELMHLGIKSVFEWPQQPPPQNVQVYYNDPRYQQAVPTTYQPAYPQPQMQYPVAYPAAYQVAYPASYPYPVTPYQQPQPREILYPEGQYLQPNGY